MRLIYYFCANNQPKNRIMNFTQENYAEHAAGEKLLVIDFWATWCGPCKKVGPIIERLASEYEGRAVIGKCDVEENPDLAALFGIRNIPTVIFVKRGQVIDKVVGANPADTYVQKIEANL